MIAKPDRSKTTTKGAAGGAGSVERMRARVRAQQSGAPSEDAGTQCRCAVEVISVCKCSREG
jgi:hypothetical protein